MSVFDGKRLTNTTFKLDLERMRAGWYSDKYFENVGATLHALAVQGYGFGGLAPRMEACGIDPAGVDVGNIAVEVQWFPRRKPFCVVVGVDKALAMLRGATGYFDEQGHFVNTHAELEVEAVHDGDIAHYHGDPLRVQPVLRVRGRYRDFAVLETPTLGILTRASRVASNVYDVLRAARGKPVLFFPARFDAHEVQAADGYAYHIAVQRFNHDYGEELSSLISTDAQGDWWGGLGGGTIPHAAIAAFLGDTVESTLAFAATRPPHIPRVALVDFDNDCIGTSLAVMRGMFARYRELIDSGNTEEAQRYKLYGVRPDTSSKLRDVSVAPLGLKQLDMGVTPRLIFQLRQALNEEWQHWDLPSEWRDRARQWCQEVKIVASGGFDAATIQHFEELNVPVDMYGIGSWLFSNSDEAGTTTDYTADVVRVQVRGKWYEMAKVGRQPCDNPNLQPVRWPLDAADERA
jgi:nicotinate phosphoribosyltransferase